MSSPPAFLQRASPPSSLIAGLAVAGLMIVGFFVVPGVVLLTRQASDGTVPCQVLRVARFRCHRRPRGRCSTRAP